MRELEIYIHIPFCVKKCGYCDFLSAPAGKEEQRLYIETLQREIRSFPDSRNYRVVSVFFGGGTPSVLEAEQIGSLMDVLKGQFAFRRDAEISVECNPGTADSKKLRQYRSYGINRISLGLQSAENRELQLLGRIHTWEQFLETYRAARSAGFENINIDLMSALPGQHTDSWKKTLQKVLVLEPEHISAYSLILEEGTLFYEKYQADARLRDAGKTPRCLPSEEEEREMYSLTENILAEAGMHRYEISNYARPGYECRHNIGYWTGTEYAGFGLGASSYLRWKEMQASVLAEDGKNYRMARIQNTADMSEYLARDFSWEEEKNTCGRTVEVLSLEDQMAEFMFLGLRMMCGISEKEFQERFAAAIDTVYAAVLQKQCRLGLLERREGRIRLTKRGIDLSNRVMAEFLL